MRIVKLLLIVSVLLNISCLTTTSNTTETTQEKSLPEIHWTTDDLMGKWKLFGENINGKDYEPFLLTIELFHDGRVVINSDTDNDGRFDDDGHHETVWEYKGRHFRNYENGDDCVVIEVDDIKFFAMPIDRRTRYPGMAWADFSDELGNKTLQTYIRDYD